MAGLPVLLGGAEARYVFGPLALVLLGFAVRSLLLRVRIDAHGVDARNLLRRHRLSWRDVVAVRMTKGSDPSGPWQTVVLELRDSRLVSLHGMISSIGSAAALDRIRAVAGPLPEAERSVAVSRAAIPARRSRTWRSWRWSAPVQAFLWAFLFPATCLLLPLISYGVAQDTNGGWSVASGYATGVAVFVIGCTTPWLLRPCVRVDAHGVRVGHHGRGVPWQQITTLQVWCYDNVSLTKRYAQLIAHTDSGPFVLRGIRVPAYRIGAVCAQVYAYAPAGFPAPRVPQLAGQPLP